MMFLLVLEDFFEDKGCCNIFFFELTKIISSLVSFHDLGRLAKMFLCHRHPAAGIANIPQL